MGQFYVRALSVLFAAIAVLAPISTSAQQTPSQGTQAIATSDTPRQPASSQLLVDALSMDGGDLATPDESPSVAHPVPKTRLPDFNRNIYYRNKLEFSLETGWLPNNIPFVFDFLVGSAYTSWPLHYTLVPNIASLRWHIDNIWGRSVFRGNTDMSFSGSYTAIPRGAETRYFAFDYGIRRNFIQPRWRVVPYVEGRGGIGNINAKEPRGVLYAQGQDMTFTLMVGSGARYNFSPRYGISAGMTYMHVSNFYLSEPRYEDFGINVYGPIVGVYMRLGKPKQTITR
jgi:hypothetical protein